VSDPLLKNDEKRIKHRKATLKCCPAAGGRRQHFRLPKKNTAGNGCFNLADPADPAVPISIMRTNRTRSADPQNLPAEFHTTSAIQASKGITICIVVEACRNSKTLVL